MAQARKFFHGIQYLRGFAALVVVLVHARHVFRPTQASWADVGTYSVEIFLVVSGFVLAHATAALPTIGPRLPIARAFLWRRLLRLLPFYWAVQLIYSAPHLVEWLARSGSLRELYWNIDPRLQALALDLLLIPHPHPDRPDAVWPLVVPGWTLNLEACFYLVFALSLLARRTSLELAVLMLVGLFLIGRLYHPADTVAGFYTQECILCFAVGIVAFRLTQWRLVGTLTLRPWLCGMVGSIGLMIGLGLLPGLGEGAIPVMVLAAGLVLLVAAMAPDSLRSRTLALLGDSSYAIYLLHTVIAFPLAHWLIRIAGLDHLRFPSAPDFLNTAPVMLFFVLISALVGIAGHKWLEKPLTDGARELSARVFRHGRGLPSRSEVSEVRTRA